MNAKFLAAEVIHAAGVHSISDAEISLDAGMFCATVINSLSNSLKRNVLSYNEFLHTENDENDFLCDVHVKLVSPNSVRYYEIEADLSAHAKIYGAEGRCRKRVNESFGVGNLKQRLDLIKPAKKRGNV